MGRKTRLHTLLLLASFIIAPDSMGQKLTTLVDPFLGTGGHGHVYPGATVPFGMVQLSPDNGDEGWDWCSGYHYSSNTIAGFSHTHLSGTGIGDWYDISVLPLTDTTEIRKEKIRLPFSHTREKASPGYYSVQLDNQVTCELTAAERTGYHRYTFPKNSGWLRFDMGFRLNWDEPTAGMLELVDDRTLAGYRYSTGWAKGQKVHFVARFSAPVRRMFFIDDSLRSGRKAEGRKVKIALEFQTSVPLYVQVSLSSVSPAKALQELRQTGNPSFDMAREKAESLWEKELQKISIDTRDKALATKFYTSLYRTCLAPVVHSDADGQYRNHDTTLRTFTRGANKYTVFSQWDVFRALHPLFTITQRERVPDMINSMLQFRKDNGLLPVWDISGWEANTMTGYHSIPIIADAILKDIPGFDYREAYEAMRASAFQDQRGTPDYIQYGYVPQDKHGWSVTMTLEYAYDDWCIAQVAKKLGIDEDFALFAKRAESYKALFDGGTGFFRARDSKGKFIEPFDPLKSEHGFEGQYIEGTAWQHSFFIPHDLRGLSKLLGGREYLIAKLDQLFTAPSEMHGDNVSMDVTGLIGQYAHGNEPSHHIAYMYTAMGHPTKAARWLRVIADSFYKTGPEGLIGNDDCGQMSAWYVWTCLGIYPLNPAGGDYVFGYPMVDGARIQVPGGKTCEIRIKREKTGGLPVIEKAVWNGEEIPVRSINHKKIMQGGVLELTVIE